MTKSFSYYEWGSSFPPVLVIDVEYVSQTDDYVEDSDKGTLHKLEVIARSHCECFSFFAEVAKLMRRQDTCPCGADDLHIHLSPAFKITMYRDEEEFNQNSPRNYSFIRFEEEFYHRVSSYHYSRD